MGRRALSTSSQAQITVQRTQWQELWGRQVADAALRAVGGMVATSFAAVAASKHRRWWNMKSADASLSGAARSDANSAEDVATTTLASDPVSPLRRSSLSKHVNRRSNSFTHMTRRSILVSSLSQLPTSANPTIHSYFHISSYLPVNNLP